VSDVPPCLDPAMASPAMRRFTLQVVSKLALALRQAAYERKKAASKLKKEQEKAAKTTARNRSYVQKMLSLPKLIFTEQVNFSANKCWKRYAKVSYLLFVPD